MVEFPPDEMQEVCAICGDDFKEDTAEFASQYANFVCETCDQQAVTHDHQSPKHGHEYRDKEPKGDDGKTPTITLNPDVGDNPVFISGHKCWRRYRFGGWITQRDEYDCDSLDEFYNRHY